jgi:hypothetical protein
MALRAPWGRMQGAATQAMFQCIADEARRRIGESAGYGRAADARCVAGGVAGAPKDPRDCVSRS